MAFAPAAPAASKTESKPKNALEAAAKGDVFYTKFSLFYENNRHITTNYRRGILLPVNTEVTFQKATRDQIHILLHGTTKVVIENVGQYSGEDIVGVFERTFSKTKVDLSGFTDSERSAILQGGVAKGMSKKAVIVALGYPPKHKTPTLESDQWRYWNSRHGTFIVHFKDDKVIEIQD